MKALIDKLAALHKAATAEPWTVEVALDGSGDLMINGTGVVTAAYVGDVPYRPNADLVVELRNALPELIAKLGEIRAAVSALDAAFPEQNRASSTSGVLINKLAAMLKG